MLEIDPNDPRDPYNIARQMQLERELKKKRDDEYKWVIPVLYLIGFLYVMYVTMQPRYPY